MDGFRLNQLVFRVEEGDDVYISPEVDGELLEDLVEAFETSRAQKPAGGYGGIAAWWVTRQGDLGDFYLPAGRYGSDTQWVLGCGGCGEAGCWPLEVEVTGTETTVTWTKFAQPFRPERDYGDFGPFVFDRHEYEAAITRAAASIRKRAD